MDNFKILVWDDDKPIDDVLEIYLRRVKLILK